MFLQQTIQANPLQTHYLPVVSSHLPVATPMSHTSWPHYIIRHALTSHIKLHLQWYQLFHANMCPPQHHKVQGGRGLNFHLTNIIFNNPAHGPIFLKKVDLSDKYMVVVLQLLGNSCACYNNNCKTNS